MKKTIFLLAIALATITSSAQSFRFGVKGGVNLNRTHFDDYEESYSPKDQIGFTGGVIAEFEFGSSGFALDGALMYTHRSSENFNGEKVKRDYLSIPVNLKYKFPLGAVKQYFAPFIFTGPEWGANLNDRERYYNRWGYRVSRTDIAWNIGAGIEIARHLQLSASYGLCINNGVKCFLGEYDTGDIYNGKDHCWTFAAALLF